MDYMDLTVRCPKKGVKLHHTLRAVAKKGCFTNVSRALQNNFAKIYNARNYIYGENFKLKLCTYAQSMALGTRAKSLMVYKELFCIYHYEQ